MSEYVKIASGIADQYLKAMTEAQDQYLKTVSSFASFTPPVAPAPVAGFTPDLPTPREIAEANFAFASKLLSQQKAFADKLFAATPSAV